MNHIGIGQCGIGRAKMAEPIEVPFRIMNEVSPRNCHALWHHLANMAEQSCMAAMSRSATMGSNMA